MLRALQAKFQVVHTLQAALEPLWNLCVSSALWRCSNAPPSPNKL